MTQRQQVFCENLVEGMSQSAAYRLAYPSCKSDSAARANASRLLTNDSIQQKIGTLQKLTHTEKALSWQQKREVLARIAMASQSTPMEVLAAIKLDNQMAGHDKPQKLEIDSGLSIVERIRSRAKQQ